MCAGEQIGNADSERVSDRYTVAGSRYSRIIKEFCILTGGSSQYSSTVTINTGRQRGKSDIDGVGAVRLDDFVIQRDVAGRKIIGSDDLVAVLDDCADLSSTNTLIIRAADGALIGRVRQDQLTVLVPSSMYQPTNL